MTGEAIIPVETVERSILVVRGQRVMLDEVLAVLYEVPVKVLNQAVKRNIVRFPEDFMFQLTAEEAGRLRSQFVTLDVGGRGQHRKYLPYAFTEQGVAMLSGVLKSDRAVQVNIEIMRAFVRLRGMLAENAEFAERITALEEKCDAQFRVVFEEIRALMAPNVGSRSRIGFVREGDG